MDLDGVLLRAVSMGASDVHLKLGQPPVVRRDGDLERLADVAPLTEDDLSQVLFDITARQTTKRVEFEHTGDLDLAYMLGNTARFRVSGFRQRGATSFALRLIPDVVTSFDDLRLPGGVRRLAEERQGIVLVTGATGSGKTTTMAAIVDHVNRTRRHHIVTIEDPVEILHADRQCIVSQRDVGDDTSSYLEALRRALRQDPDVLVIGELRDAEAAQTALNAAESGHFVLTTLHTLDAEESVKRMIDFFPAEKQPLVRNILAAVLRGIVSQRLLPRVNGGRIVAVEVMARNDRIAEAIREGRPEEIPSAIREGAFFEMQTLNQALIELVLSGEVDREVAASAAPFRHDFMIALRQATQRRAASQENGAAGIAVQPRVEPASLGVRRPAAG